MIADAMLADGYCACSDALAGFFRDHSAKALARITGAGVQTAEGWKKGKWPQSRHMVALTSYFGTAFLDAVFAPVCTAEAPLARRIARVEADLQSIKKEISDAESLAARLGGSDDAGGGAVRGRRALAVGLAAARRMTAAGLACLCLWSALTVDPDDDDWLRPRPAAARVLRIARTARRDGVV